MLLVYVLIFNVILFGGVAFVYFFKYQTLKIQIQKRKIFELEEEIFKLGRKHTAMWRKRLGMSKYKKPVL